MGQNEVFWYLVMCVRYEKYLAKLCVTWCNYVGGGGGGGVNFYMRFKIASTTKTKACRRSTTTTSKINKRTNCSNRSVLRRSNFLSQPLQRINDKNEKRSFLDTCLISNADGLTRPMCP